MVTNKQKFCVFYMSFLSTFLFTIPVTSIVQSGKVNRNGVFVDSAISQSWCCLTGDLLQFILSELIFFFLSNKKLHMQLMNP